MKALVIALALTMPVPAAAEGIVEWGYCRLYPSKCRPAAPAAPVQAPIPAPAPVPAPAAPAPQVTPQAPPVAAPVVVPHRAAKRAKPKAVKVKPAPVKVKARPKSKFKAAPKRARSGGVVRWWCSYAPKWATPAQIVAGAKTRGYTVSHADAQACLASKT